MKAVSDRAPLLEQCLSRLQPPPPIETLTRRAAPRRYGYRQTIALIARRRRRRRRRTERERGMQEPLIFVINIADSFDCVVVVVVSFFFCVKRAMLTILFEQRQATGDQKLPSCLLAFNEETRANHGLTSVCQSRCLLHRSKAGNLTNNEGTNPPIHPPTHSIEGFLLLSLPLLEQVSKKKNEGSERLPAPISSSEEERAQ